MTVRFGIDELPAAYRAVEVRTHDSAVSPIVELARWLAEEERALGRRPTVLFRSVAGHEGAVVLGNPCPKPVLLAEMGLDRSNWTAALSERLEQSSPGVHHNRPQWTKMSGLGALPVPQHRPGDAGRYITAGVAMTRSLDGDLNLGVYRIQLVHDRKARIFFDPRTDAHRNWHAHLAAGRRMSVTVFIGASPVHLLAGASRLPVRGSDFDTAARLLGRPVELDEQYGVPADAQYVVTGTVGVATETEGPFAEFKGYYMPERQSPVLEIDEVVSAARPCYPTIVTGAESGLTLMSLQNEYLMHAHLRALGFPVLAVDYPHDARAEFLCVVTTPEPTRAMLRAAMEFDTRAKFVVCSSSAENFWQAIAAHGFSAVVDTYYRKGFEHGERVGLVFDRMTEGWPVEF